MLLLARHECTILPCVTATVSWALGCLEFALIKTPNPKTSIIKNLHFLNLDLETTTEYLWNAHDRKPKTKFCFHLKACKLWLHMRKAWYGKTDRHLHFLLTSISCSRVISSLQKVLNKVAYYFTEVFECCWTHFLQMLRGTEQRQLKTDLVSLQFDFITVLNSHSTSIRHHTLVIKE